MKETFVKVIEKLTGTWPMRLLASRMLTHKGMNRDFEAMKAAIAAMKAATLATDAATAAVNAAAAATAALNLSSSAIEVASEPIRNWYDVSKAKSQRLPVCPRGLNRFRIGRRGWAFHKRQIG
jgi:hypothetical protein